MEEQVQEEDLIKLTPEVEEEQIFRAEHFFGIFQNLLVTIALVLAIAFLNYQLIRFWFAGDFSQNMASIETSYVQMAKFWSEGGSLWQPQWYFGHPWSVFYTPFLPTLELVAHNILNFSFAHAYRVITGAAYVLVPVSLFLFVWQISKSRTGALVAGLFYSFLPSLMALLFGEIANDVLSAGMEPRRFAIMVRWGEGPHTLSLVFIPMFGLFLSRYFEKGRFRDLIFVSFSLALCALTNAIAVWVALLLVFSMVLSELIRGVNEFIGLSKKLFSVFLLTFGLISFWYNWQFVTTFFKEGGGALNNWLALVPWGLSVVVLIFGASFILMRKFLRKFAYLPFVIYWFLLLFAIVFIYYASGDNRLEYAPQALRLNTEVDMALATLAGFFISKIYLWGSKLGSGISKIGTVAISSVIFIVPSALILVFGMDLSERLPDHTKSMGDGNSIAIENTAEYRVATKLGELTKGSDQRVIAPGNYGFWLNYFEPVPQLRGALFQSSTNFWPEHFYYQITNGSDPEIGLALLKIANVGKLVFTGPGSGEIYKDYKVGEEKFSSVLNKVYEDRGDVYYSAPLKNDALAKVVDVNEILSVTKAKNAIDSGPIYKYVSSIEKNASKKISFEKITNGKYKIAGDVSEGEGILVQQTYDAGWRVKGGKFSKFRDAFDFLVLVPENEGKFEIELVYSKPFSVYIGYLITILTFGFIFKRAFNIRIPLKKRGVQAPVA